MPAIELQSPSGGDNVESLRKKVEDHHVAVLLQAKEKCQDALAELYFLQNGGNMMDFVGWKKKPPSLFLDYLKNNSIDQGESAIPVEPDAEIPNVTEAAINKGSFPPLSQNVVVSTPAKPVQSVSKSLSSSLPGILKMPASHTHAGRPPALAMTPEQIVEKAKQEAYVMQRIAELQREGLWSEKRLPKVAEPSRAKSHWDYLLEEMVWLAADFAQERKWKKAAARKCARMVQKYFQEKATAAAKAEKEEEQRMRKIASFVAKEIRIFWSNVEKLVEYKQQIRLEEKRKKVLDQHLNFIVNETEKYSSWLTEGLKPVKEVEKQENQKQSHESDMEFEPDATSTDDEETIAQEEILDSGDGMKREERHKEEIDALKRESEMPLEDLLNELPADYLESFAAQSSPDSVSKADEASDEEFELNSDESEADDEETIDQAEKDEEDLKNRDEELQELEAEKDMPMDKLLAKYMGNEQQEEEAIDSEGLSGESESEIEDEDAKDIAEDKTEAGRDVGLESLFEDTATGQGGVTSSKLSDAAALAESFQPKGNTLESTQVVAKVPFLLKHSLREYQHIGLDWMAAMYERKLNGILADEMGLGKTIQTIALLAWLACEKGIWGPHLVVVPTSVMLNWEMEFKKWCPAFKILTYYGSQKDRKQKRMGWTKPNAFHVCITSYKLVIQDHQAFRRKRWRYFILDEAQNIKNFKSQRWQLLLNFQSQRRLLLTGTPLQNNLMELWSLMHFLMPDIFESHRDFREWFSNPVTGMIEGNAEYNESIIRRLHKVLRPFILRRLKSEVEKQLPQKYEHVVMCRLSKRQRYLYDDFMSKAKTKETLASGNLLSVINVLMQLRKVCNHPNLFEPRPIVSPFQMNGIIYQTASLVYGLLDYSPFQHVNLFTLNLLLADLEMCLTAFAAHRIRRFQAQPQLIQEIDNAPPLPPPCPRGKIRLHVRSSNNQSSPVTALGRGIPLVRATSAAPGITRPGGPFVPSTAGGVASPQQPRLAAPAPLLPSTAVAAAVSGASTRSPVHLQIVQQSGNLHTVSFPVAQASTPAEAPAAPRGVAVQLPQGGEAHLSLPSSIAQQFLHTSSPSTVANNTSNQPSGGPRILLTRVSTSNAVTDLQSSGTPRITIGQNVIKPSQQSSAPAQLVTTRSRSSVDGSNSTQNGPDHSTDNKRPCKWSYDRSLFKTTAMDEKKRQERRERLTFLANLNKKRCEACPIYGSDLIEAVTLTSKPLSPLREDTLSSELNWSGLGASYVNCLHAAQPLVGRRRFEALWAETDTLRSMIHTPSQYVEELRDTIQRFVVCVPAVTAPSITFHTSHPPPSKLWDERRRDHIMQSELSPLTSILHPIESATMTQFPDPRLIQYDCGKLQTLDRLLRHLKTEKHRVLIFTQMTRMLDVLEAFLNYHGHIYLRLDGTTRVDQRQVLMERFNADRRIFCFILSTRSGGIGVNLTGADTVIFYDSDWNPTMDAQAQDRCHRIGQTRDVHIYRLISERTVEENILKKANQKRLLGDIAIEGGNFTAAFFKKQTIHDLFEVDQEEADSSKRMEEILERSKDVSETSSVADGSTGAPEGNVTTPSMSNKAALGILESALAAAEDETDVAAARTVRAEAAAEMAEFDESAPIANNGEDGENGVVEVEINRAEAELQQLEHQLTPVERYAMRFMETIEECWGAEQLRAAEAQIEEQKKAWEMKRLAALSEADSERIEDSIGTANDPEGGLLTFVKQDAVNQIWVAMDGTELMPVWCPPTPPQDEGDVYIDYTLAYLYESQAMDESRLPPVYVRKELKRTRKESVHVQPDDGRRPAKIRKEETVYAPRSLFDRPSPALAKLRRDLKLQKFRGIVRPPVPLANLSLKAPPVPIRPIEELENTPEWLIHEDWILLQAVQNLLELPLNLIILTPAHIPNWDLVADMVNSYSRTYRSPKQCRNRYISVILPREEGKAVVDTSPRKMKKTKALVRPAQQFGISKTNNRPVRTSQLFVADNNSSFTSAWHQKFDTLKSISLKKAPTNRSLLSGSSNLSAAGRGTNNVKHAGVLQEAGIAYDTPLNPVQVAALRAERIAQKQKTAAAMAEQLQAQQQQRPNAIPPASPAGGTNITPGSPITTSRLTPIPVPSPSTSTLAVNQVQPVGTSSVATAVVMGGIGTSTGTGQHALLLQGTNSTPLQAQGQQQLVLQPAGTAIRTQRPVATLTVQEMVAGTSQLRAQQPGLQPNQHTIGGTNSSTVPGQTVVSVGNLTAVQVQAAAHMLASAGITVSGGGQLNTITTTAAGTTAGVKGAAVTIVQTTTTAATPATAATKALTPSQLQFFRQQALLKQQQQRMSLQEQQLKKLQLSTAGTGTPTTQVATGTASQKIPFVASASTTAATSLSNFTTVQLAGTGAQSQQGARTQLVKGSTATALIGKGGTTVARTIVSETEMAAFLKRQQQQKGSASTTGIQGTISQQHTVQIGTSSTAAAGITTAQLLAQAGLQVQTAPAAGGQQQVATLVKTVSAPGSLGGAPSVTIPVSAISVGLPQVQVKSLTTTNVKTAATHQLRQIAIQQQLLQRKTQNQQPKAPQLAQTVTLGTVKGNVVSVPAQHLGTAVGTVQLVQPVTSSTAGVGSSGSLGTTGNKPGTLSTTVTMQQLQHVIRQVTAGNAQVLVSSPSTGVTGGTPGTAILTKQQGPARVIPVTQQGLKQTIQVVTTGQPNAAGGTTRVTALNAAGAGGSVAPGLASALAAGTLKVAGGTEAQQKALLSQVSAALQNGQPVSLAVRAGPNVSGSPARLLTTAALSSIASIAGVATATTTLPVTTTATIATPSADALQQPSVSTKPNVTETNLDNS